MNLVPVVGFSLLCGLGSVAENADSIRLASNPSLSPDGSVLAFSWRGEIWTVPVGGGVARPMTTHPGRDREPHFSPDGKDIAFVSDREGSPQVFVMPASGGAPKQITFHTAGYSLHGFFGDGRDVLVSGSRDHYWGRHTDRFFRVRRDERRAEELLFDDFGRNGRISPDGKRLLFTREGPAWWRKGYRGSQASQVWMYELDSQRFSKLLDHPTGCTWPLWRPDGRGFYYVGAQKGSFNLWEYDLDAKTEKQLTQFEDDSVVFPCISRDGSTIVFRHLFDFYRFQPGRGETPTKIEITHAGDAATERIARRSLTQATDVAFSRDGLEIACIAGGDLWVMDTELREPRQIMATPEEERDPVFAPDGNAILFVSDRDGQSDLWRAERSDASKYWWQNDSFKVERLTRDADVESNLKWSPDGSRVAYVRGLGDLWTIEPTGKGAKRVVASWNAPEYDWSPDGKWLVYARSDNDFNRDIWLFPVDGSREPFNLSRHPDNDGDPVWSPDGKIIAFTGRRTNDDVDILFVYLQAADAETDRRDRTMQKAIDKMKKSRSKTATPKSKSAVAGKSEQAKPDEPDATKSDTGETPKGDATQPDATGRKPLPTVTIDFDRIHQRIQRVTIPNSSEGGLFWSADSRKLAFTASVDGRRGTYTIDFPDDLRPKLLTSQTGSHPRWSEIGNQILWLSAGLPGTLSATGQSQSYRFRALQAVDVAAKNRAAFDLCWRTMRDRYYDERLGNRNWDAIRRKYSDMAAAAPDSDTFATVVQLMLGELNGSHLGFTAFSGRSAGPEPEPPAIGDDGISNDEQGMLNVERTQLRYSFDSRYSLFDIRTFLPSLFQTPPVQPPAQPPGQPPTPPQTPQQPTGGPSAASSWSVTTAHLGVRFDSAHKGPGLKVRDVIPESPADHKQSRIEPGEIILSIDGTTVDPSMDLTIVLNGPPERDIHLAVKNAAGQERHVTVRPVSYSAVRSQLYQKWVRDNQTKVDELSGGKLGYLHISGMNMPSFYKFEEELYNSGSGKDGLVIDVRENPGGSTTDHLLTALTQPHHATTVPRGGGPGYPQDRMVYATWRKPIVVLCNQNSFSNAEIFSHAIKTLGRGKLVGVPTAGGVISTGAATIMDVGILRLPNRGWFVRDTGEDMELNGAVPDVILWPEPGDMPRGKDVQLEKAVDVLLADVKAWQERPQPTLRKASER
jgi:Tol biopolymer transport system component/C-terminal processing protease CtpA/Prc